MTKTLWYAEGLRWIGSLLTGAAARLERNAAPPAPLDPRVHREIDEYVRNVRHRVHIHF